MAQIIVHVHRAWHNSENVPRQHVTRNTLAAVNAEGLRSQGTPDTCTLGFTQFCHGQVIRYTLCLETRTFYVYYLNQLQLILLQHYGLQHCGHAA